MKIIYEQLGEAHLRLLREDIVAQLPGEFASPLSKISREDKIRLLSYASTLALSDDSFDIGLAYEIATRVVETSAGDHSLVVAASFVMSRLGNFPGRQLVARRFAPDVSLSPEHRLLALESLVREIGNTVEVAGYRNVLTDFQMDFLSILNTQDSASISAPTSAGKSFVLLLSILEKIVENPKITIVYVVPTRALLGQVARSMLALLKRADIELPVRGVPIPLGKDVESGCVYVLTQERLISLLQSLNVTQCIDVLVVDEAQSIGDGARGVLLQTSIERVKSANSKVRIFFASPLSKNPGILMDYFGVGRKKGILQETHSPVLQNIILVRSVSRFPRKAAFSVLNDFGEYDVGVSNIDFNFRRNSSKIKAEFAKNITRNEESTIIYCNFPKQTEDVACQLSLLLDDVFDQDINDFIVFLKEHIHEEYLLVDSLAKGVAYHYGSMPNIVRTRIEQLASSGKIRYICCTSTLLQGVNLPAKHIVIDRPRKGRTTPMGRADFLNLAGRAGRLLKEFQGNVWCLQPDFWDMPDGAEVPCYKGNDTEDIKIAFLESFSDGGKHLIDVLKDTKTDVNKEDDLGIAALGKIFGDFILSGKNLQDSYLSKPEISEQLKLLQIECESVELNVPKEIICLNPNVHPLRLQSLYSYIAGHDDFDMFLPMHPHCVGSNDRLKFIFKIVSLYLERDESRSYLFDSWLANEWIHDATLKSIIDNRIYYLQKKAQDKNENAPSSRDVIFELMEALQNRIRFKYVKNLRVYRQILSHCLLQIGREDDAENIVPIDLFLECGSASSIVLSLIGIGLTRTTALMLKGKIRFPDDFTPEMCLGILASTDVDKMDIPSVCRKEVLELLRF